MKKPLLLLLAFLCFLFQVQAQKNACDNTVLIYAPPTKISTPDSTAHESIRKYFYRYLISQQQTFNYKLVEKPEDANVELITTYILRNPGFWNQTTEMEFTVRDIQDTTISRTIIEAYNSEKDDYWMASKDMISHKGSDFLEVLQRQNTLHAFFAPLDQKYRHKAEPDQVLIVMPFKAEKDELTDHINCLQDFVMKGMQIHARFVGHNINISFQEVPNTTPENIPVIKIFTEIEDFYDEYVLYFSTEDGREVHEVTIPKKFLAKGIYRPFIEGKLLAAGGGLITRIIFAE